MMGFTLKITNAPLGSTHWAADFYSEEEGTFIASGALALDEAWDCTYNPYGATDLRVRVLDMVHAITLHDAPNLGPIEDGKSYTYDCSTGVLYEAIPTLALLPLAIIGGVGLLVAAAVVLSVAMPRPRG